MKAHTCLRSISRFVLFVVLAVTTARGDIFMLDVDFGGDTPSGKTGPAAIGQSSSDFWNVYLRTDGMGGWRTFGTLDNMLLVNGTATAIDMSVANAPGAWSSGSLDPMYNDYIYPFGGDATITLTGLPAGLYDLYAYSADGNMEATVGALSYGVRTTLDPGTSNPPVWIEGEQYARFRNLAMDGSAALTLTVRNGTAGYAIIHGLQIVAVPEPSSVALLGCVLLSGLFWKRAQRRQALLLSSIEAA